MAETNASRDSIKITAKNLDKLIALIEDRYATKASAIQAITVNGVEQPKTNGTVELSGFTASEIGADPAGSASAVQTNLNAHTSNTSNPHGVTKAQVGLENVDNKSSETIRSEITSENVTDALGFTPLDAALKGTANGVAELDESGKVPQSMLPSYVDDVEDYAELSMFPEIGESGKIYVDDSTNKTYRWSGSDYVEISASLALGETSGTAYRGDRGKIAYDHSQTQHAPADAEANVQSDWNETDTSSDAYIHNKPTSMPANGGNAATVNNHSVETDVPEGAKFTDTTYGNATTSAAGLMSSTDKSKLDGIESGATKTIVDSNLSETSSNPLENKAIKAALDTKMDASNIISTTISIPTSSWAADTTYSSYGYKATVADSSIAATDTISITLSVTSLAIAEAAYVSAGGESYDGGIYLYAKSIPSADLSGAMVIVKG